MPLILGIDPNLNVTYSRVFQPANMGYKISMSATTQEQLDVPPGATQALFQIQSGATVYIGPQPISAAQSDWEEASDEMNPALMSVGINAAVTTLYFYALEACEVKVTFY